MTMRLNNLRRCIRIPVWRRTHSSQDHYESSSFPNFVSDDGRYHLSIDRKPLYPKKFLSVLSFHQPENLAAVLDEERAAYHIDLMGRAAYHERFLRTFGFYCGLAGVQDTDGLCFHILPSGKKAYDDRYAWVGNFARVLDSASPARCTVRDESNSYWYIDTVGQQRMGPFAYAGDFSSNGEACVIDFNGHSTIIDICGKKIYGNARSTYFDVKPPHKGIAAVKDSKGWYFVDRAGIRVGSQPVNFWQVEPHYNGQSLVELHTGQRAVVDEDGRTLLKIPISSAAIQEQLTSLSLSYWNSLALKIILHFGLLDNMGSGLPNAAVSSRSHWTITDPTFHKVLMNVCEEMGLVELISGASEYSITFKGLAIFEDNNLRERLQYWLQDRYLKAWLPTLASSPISANDPVDTFKDLADNKVLLALSQRVLAEYAKQDWSGIAETLHLRDSDSIVVDLAGGASACLLRELEKSKLRQYICMELPEVVTLSCPAVDSTVQFVAGDLFEGPLPQGDVYLLSRVLHDWSDSKAMTILKRVAASSPSHATVKVIDRVAQNNRQHAMLSLHMYLLQRAHERSLTEWEYLFSKGGWKLTGTQTFNDHHVFSLEKEVLSVDEVNSPSLTVPSMTSSVNTGTSLVNKAVVPIAGLATRMMPQSVALPKALLPIVSRNGSCRPAILLLLEQLLRLNMDICIVSSPSQLPIVYDLLNSLTWDNQQSCLSISPSTTMMASARTSTFLNDRIHVVIQDQPNGLGHAVLQAESFVGNNHFIVALGDHVFHKSTIDDMLSVFQSMVHSRLDASTLALTGSKFCSSTEISKTGLLLPDMTAYQPRQYWIPYLVSDMAEKPIEYSKFALPEGFLSQLGVDILPPTIFQELRTMGEAIADQSPACELCLRAAMQNLQKNGKLYTCVSNGIHSALDIGNPSDYWGSLNAVYKRPHLYEYDDHFRYASVTKEDLVQWLCNDSSPLPRNIVGGHMFFGSAPSRIDLMGGIADYSGSEVCQYPLDLSSFCLATLHSENDMRSGRIELFSIHIPSVKGACSTGTNANSMIWMKSFSSDVILKKPGLTMDFCDSRTLKERLTAKMSTCVEGEPKNWPSYVLGVVLALSERSKTPFHGATVVIVSDVPVNCGLASSASLTMSIAKALAKALKQNLDSNALALLCQNVENEVVGAGCGMMDHITAAHTAGGACLKFTCIFPFEHEHEPELVHLPKDLAVFALHSGVMRSVTDRPYSRVQIASMMGKAIINKKSSHDIQHLCSITPARYMKSYRHLLPEYLSGVDFVQQYGQLERSGSKIIMDDVEYPILAATEHPIYENHRVAMFFNALNSLEYERSHAAIVKVMKQLGELMLQSHQSYSMCGLGSTQTDLLVSLVQDESVFNGDNRPFIGAKISGGGSGGVVAVLGKKDHCHSVAAIARICERYFSQTGISCRPISRYKSNYRSFTTNRGSMKPRILLVNHGYPPDFNGGKEVYTQTLALNMHRSGVYDSVSVFAREHDPFRPDFQVRFSKDPIDPNISVLLVNHARESPYGRYVSAPIDAAFSELVEKINPDVVHFGHLNHLSLNLPAIAKQVANAKVVYTLHDYWLMCPRGQFLIVGASSKDPWEQCGCQVNSKCASKCFSSRFASGMYSDSAILSDAHSEEESNYWEKWIADRMQRVTDLCSNSIDAFIAPSQTLRNRFISDFNIETSKIHFLPYGFDRQRLSGRSRSIITTDQPFVFAYIGRHTAAKGLHLLVEAASIILRQNPSLCAKFKIIIFGRPDISTRSALQRMIEDRKLNDSKQETIEWRPEYANENIVTSVFNVSDCIVVPSIWSENSPLVIHEAQQCGVPVITSAEGGMGELVKSGVNGLTFKHRDAQSLAEAMENAIYQQEGLKDLGRRGYLYSSDGQVPSIDNHLSELRNLYASLLNSKLDQSVKEHTAPAPSEQLSAPWRVTFDTNPDDCNFSCTMCEQHSEFSPHQKQRRADKIRRRRMDFKLIEQKVSELAPRGLKEIIPTTMGEPLMYKEFPNMISLCHKHDIKLNLTTNGSFIGRGVDAWARLIVPVTSDVKISWNGATDVTQRRIMKHSSLDQQLRNLKQFISIRNDVADNGGNYCSVTLQLTFMEQNLDEIPSIVALAIENGCDRLKGHHLWAHFDEIRDQDLRRDAHSVGRWNSIAAKCREYADCNFTARGKKIKLENFSDLSASTTTAATDSAIARSPVNPTAICPFLGKEAWVNHSGRFDPCCAPDKQRKSLGSFGTINLKSPGAEMSNTSLVAIWQSA